MPWNSAGRKLGVIAEEDHLVLAVSLQSVGDDGFLAVGVSHDDHAAGIALVVAQHTGVLGVAFLGQHDFQADHVFVQGQLVGNGVGCQQSVSSFLCGFDGGCAAAAAAGQDAHSHHAGQGQCKNLFQFHFSYLIFVFLMFSLPEKQTGDTVGYSVYCNIHRWVLQCSGAV